MQPSPTQKHIRTRIIEKLAHGERGDMAVAQSMALNLFFELSLEYEALRDFKSLCVLVPDLCLGTPASLYMRGPRGTLQLRRTTNTQGQKFITFPEPSCPQPTSIIRHEGLSAAPICEAAPEGRLIGVLCLHRQLLPAEEIFYLEYARRIAQVMAIKQASIGNRQRLTFINNLVRDIGHNVIVPNMHFKLLFLQMEKQIAQLGSKVDALAPIRPDAPDREIRHELPMLIKNLQAQQEGISRRFQQSSLFLESLLRRSHFEKGKYDLLLRPCKFKSQIFEPQIERFRPLLRAQGITIRIDPDVRIDEDIVLEADLGLISQVFANLLANAVKYTKAMPTDSGQTEKLLLYGWEFRPHAFGSGHPGFRLFVSTTGSEIPREDWPKLFDADFRSNASDLVEGSGHGLYFVKQIVELHRGRVGYTYDAPMNSFHIILPSPQKNPAQTETGSCPTPS